MDIKYGDIPSRNVSFHQGALERVTHEGNSLAAYALNHADQRVCWFESFSHRSYVCFRLLIETFGSHVVSVSAASRCITLDNGTKVYCLSNSEHLRGLQFSYIGLPEGYNRDSEAYNQVIRACVIPDGHTYVASSPLKAAQQVQ